MKQLSEQQYLAMREGADVTAADHYGDKVLRLADGTYLKLFRVKRLFTSARIFPYSSRFVKGAEKLKALGVPTLDVIEIFRINHLKRTAVHYNPLPGHTLRELPVPFDDALAKQFGSFIRDLHDKGVYLRSMHLGNVVLTPEGELGLIDIADMRIFKRSLPDRLRLRNFDHLARYDEDRKTVATQAESFLSAFEPAFAEKLRPKLGGSR